MSRARTLEFLRFCIVGLLGFAVDAGGMELLVAAGLSAETARFISIPLALQVTYVLHGVFTFKKRGGIFFRGWALFMIFNAIGAAVNYVVFVIALRTLDISPAQLHRMLALLAGTGAGLVFNYLMNRNFVFSARKKP